MKNSRKGLIKNIFILFIILVLPIFLVKEYQIIKSKKDSRLLNRSLAVASSFDNQEEDKAFVFIVLTANAQERIKQNFQSIFKQKYRNFRVVYLEHNSQDHTMSILENAVIEAKQQSKTSIFRFQKIHELFKKYHEVINACQNNEVVIHLNANDWLAHDNVLSDLNYTYSNSDIWLTYGQYLDYPTYKQGVYNPLPKKNIYKKSMQKAPWMRAHLKTFYAGLFKKMRFGQESEDYFLTIKDEKEFLLPLVEVGKAHVKFIPSVLYIHNREESQKIFPSL